MKLLHVVPIRLYVGSELLSPSWRQWLSAVTVTLWGVIMMCNAAPSNFAGLMAARFFLGVMEGSCPPAFVVMISHWYK